MAGVRSCQGLIVALLNVTACALNLPALMAIELPLIADRRCPDPLKSQTQLEALACVPTLNPDGAYFTPQVYPKISDGTLCKSRGQ